MNDEHITRHFRFTIIIAASTRRQLDSRTAFKHFTCYLEDFSLRQSGSFSIDPNSIPVKTTCYPTTHPCTTGRTLTTEPDTTAYIGATSTKKKGACRARATAPARRANPSGSWRLPSPGLSTPTNSTREKT